MTNNKDDTISREALKEAIYKLSDDSPIYSYPRYLLERQKVLDTIDNASTVEYPFYQEAYQTGYEEGYAQGYIDGSTGADWRDGAE